MALLKQMNRFENWLRIANLDKKDHQMEGIKWCLNRELTLDSIDSYLNDIKGGILADEMGLGKTILMLGCIISNPKRHTLIVVPSALLDQWKKNIIKFFNHKPLIYHGSYVKKTSMDDLIGARVVLTTYGMISNRKTKKIKPYHTILWDVEWDRIIYDEAHHMRNTTSNIYKGAKKMKGDIKWMVTGTPIQNVNKDLKALMYLLNISCGYANYRWDERVVNKYILKRSKVKVGIKMPPIHDYYIDVPIKDEEEYRLVSNLHYSSHFSDVTLDNVDNIIRLLDGNSIFPIITACRQACVYPRILTDKWIQLISSGLIDFDIDLPIIENYSKVNAIVNKVIEQKNNGRKIIFCHYHKEIDIIATSLRHKGISVATYDGRVSNKQRKTILNSTSSWADMFIYKSLPQHITRMGHLIKQFVDPYLTNDVLIMQIMSGCEGLNLQDYNQIYFTSPHWNPAVEDQAVARAHRIGQKKPVSVFRFVTKIENKDNNHIVNKPYHNSLDDYCIMVQQTKRTLMQNLNNSLR